MILREARQTDAQQIAALHAASWCLAYRGALSDKFLAEDIATERSVFWANCLQSKPFDQHAIVAEHMDKIVGFACVYANFDVQWGSLLDNLHVSQSLQRQGIGTKLLIAVARWCKSSNTSGGLFLWVLQSNLEAQHFYQARGAENTGSDIWIPPGGGYVPRYRFAWHSVSLLLNKAAEKSLQPAFCEGG